MMLDYWLLAEAESRLGARRAQAERDHLARQVAGLRRPRRIVLADALRRLADSLDAQPDRLNGRRGDLILGEG
jgi:hypothetical protein